ncbi:ABC transporter substrate-binding protein [Pseudactinotalea sp. Z1748]|uniref:ABC transporter substrate-binding protein n=1 Tax=Pseudactinotalea sp. Z1748 TaxID=3413027 RepID=UPI003C7E836B
MRSATARAATAAIAAAMFLTACGGGNDGGGGGDTGTSGGDGSLEADLKMVESLTNPARTQLLRGLLDEFEDENPGVSVELISPPTEQADQTLQQMLQSGSGVDVLEVRDITVGPFGNNGWLHDMTDELDGWDGWEAMTDNAVENSTQGANGETFYIPYGFYGLSLFYRADLIADAGFDAPPHSWDELVEQANAIQNPAENRYGYAFRGGQNGTFQLAAAIEAYVGTDLDPENSYLTTSGETIFSTPQAQEAADMYLTLFEEGSPPSSVAWGYPEMVEGFTNGSTAFLLQDPEVIATVSESSLEEDQWDVTPLPVGASGHAAQPVATAGWGVASSSDHTEAAVALVQFLSGEASTTFAKENSMVPIRTEANEDPFYSSGPWEAYMTMTQDPDTYLNVHEPRGVQWWTEWNQKADNELQSLLLGEMTTEELLQSWDEYWTEKLADE